MSGSAERISVTVVIATHNRCEECKRAVMSALEQEPPPLEVLVCDDGSTDATREEFEKWQTQDSRLRYLRLEPNRGTPAPARNLGVATAAGEWVAFLDDDDRWLPNKLALQAPLLNDSTDVIAGDAIRSDGRTYFGANSGPSHPTRVDIERANPVILSSALARRRLLLDVHGFDENRAVAGIEDYDLWLRLADRGARFTILNVPTVEYEDVGEDKLSGAPLKIQGAILRLRWRRVLRAPGDRLAFTSALREIYLTTRMAVAARLRQ